MTTYLADPENITCPYCQSAAGAQCRARRSGARRRVPHKSRAKLALVLAAHSDPALDEHWPGQGLCGLCGTPGLGARHRVIDAIAGRLSAGEDAEEVAGDYGKPVEAVEAVRAWCERWPGAWL